MIKCLTGKKGYQSQSLAEDALIEAHIQYDYGNRTGPVNVYKCEECGQYHLTSRGETNPRLETFRKEGHLGKHKQAAQWLHKLKK